MIRCIRGYDVNENNIKKYLPLGLVGQLKIIISFI